MDETRAHRSRPLRPFWIRSIFRIDYSKVAINLSWNGSKFKFTLKIDLAVYGHPLFFHPNSLAARYSLFMVILKGSKLKFVCCIILPGALNLHVVCRFLINQKAGWVHYGDHNLVRSALVNREESISGTLFYLGYQFFQCRPTTTSAAASSSPGSSSFSWPLLVSIPASPDQAEFA